MSDNVKAATVNYLLWLSWYPGDYKGATTFAGNYLETPAGVDELQGALAGLSGTCPDCGETGTGAGFCISCGGLPV